MYWTVLWPRTGAVEAGIVIIPSIVSVLLKIKVLYIIYLYDSGGNCVYLTLKLNLLQSTEWEYTYSVTLYILPTYMLHDFKEVV